MKGQSSGWRTDTRGPNLTPFSSFFFFTCFETDQNPNIWDLTILPCSEGCELKLCQCQIVAIFSNRLYSWLTRKSWDKTVFLVCAYNTCFYSGNNLNAANRGFAYAEKVLKNATSIFSHLRLQVFLEEALDKYNIIPKFFPTKVLMLITDSNHEKFTNTKSAVLFLWLLGEIRPWSGRN